MSSVPSTDSEVIDISELYSVGNPYAIKDERAPTRPFLHGIEIHNVTGEVVRVTAFIDSGAMTNVMCSEVWKRVGRRLGQSIPSWKKLRMANGTVVPSEGTWMGQIVWGGKKVCGQFEIFPSGGSWSFLLGKPLLEQFGAIYRYDTDTILLRDGTQYVELQNRATPVPVVSQSQGRQVLALPVHEISHLLIADADDTSLPKAELQHSGSSFNRVMVEEVEDEYDIHMCQHLRDLQQTAVANDGPLSPRQPDHVAPATTGAHRTQRHRPRPAEFIAGWRRRRIMKRRPSLSSGEETTEVVSETDDYVQIAPTLDGNTGTQWSELPVDDDKVPKGIYTRVSNPHQPQRVEAILHAITIGQDLSEEERTEVRNLISEFADCFALSVSEVTAVKDAIHRLNVNPESTFSKTVHQRPLTPPQRQYLNSKIDELLAAGIIEPCSPDDVKCIAPIILAQKAHEGQGLTLDELRYRVNEECVAAGLEPAFESGTKPVDVKLAGPTDHKWRICMNYGEINKHTVIAPMPQGDIRMKQQNVSGHCWVCTFDFASGFYAVTVAPESRPYTCFYVEGRGYFWCVRMPFGLTGAPSTFAGMTAKHLHDLLTDSTMELFVDDGAVAGDDFQALMMKLRRILTRVRERGLSLSPSKSKFFMTTAVFAGALVGPQGVMPDLGKVTAVVNWPQPKDALNLASFLGLTGHFRDLIKDYARLEGPLRDLIRGVELPKNYSKTTYRRTMRGTNLNGLWGRKHTEAFLNLKKALTSEPVLR